MEKFDASGITKVQHSTVLNESLPNKNDSWRHCLTKEIGESYDPNSIKAKFHPQTKCDWV